MTEQRELWFEIRRNGYGVTPITWQGWCTTFGILVVLLASVQVILYLVRDPATTVLVIFVVTAIELAVFIPFTYRHAKSPEKVEVEEAAALAERRQKIQMDLEDWKKRNRQCS